MNRTVRPVGTALRLIAVAGLALALHACQSPTEIEAQRTIAVKPSVGNGSLSRPVDAVSLDDASTYGEVGLEAARPLDPGNNLLKDTGGRVIVDRLANPYHGATRTRSYMTTEYFW